jgi:hemerythrin
VEIDVARLAARVVDDMRDLIPHDEQDWALLASASGLTRDWAVELAGVFQKALQGNRETHQIAKRADSDVQRQVLTAWLETLITGSPGASFWAETYLVGMSHAAATVHNEHVLALGRLLEQEFRKRSCSAFSAEKANQLNGAFGRALGVALAVIIAGHAQAVSVSMAKLGFHDKATGRIRSSSIMEMIRQARTSLPLVDWNSTLCVGLRSIDEQHHEWVERLNALHQAHVSGRGKWIIGRLLRDMIAFAIKHFEYEERLMKQHDCSTYAEHRKAHVELASRLIRIKEEFQSREEELSPNHFRQLRLLLSDHIRESDRPCAAQLQVAGVN